MRFDAVESARTQPGLTSPANGPLFVSAAQQEPEWLRISDAVHRFRIGRSTLYSLIAEGLIKTALIRRRGNTTGIRLVSLDSLRAYVESFATPEKQEEGK